MVSNKNAGSIFRKNNFLKSVYNIFIWVISSIALIGIITIVISFFVFLRISPREHFDKFEFFTNVIGISFLTGIAFYFLGRKIMKENIISERSKRAQTIYNDAKTSFENGDYVRAVEKAAIVIGIEDDFLDNSDAYHVLALAQNKLGHVDSVNNHIMAAWNALRFNNPDAALYYFNAAIDFIKQENFELAYDCAQRGLTSIEKNPSGRHYKNQDFEVELRTIKLISSFAKFPGTKAFEVCKGDAEWLVNNSTDPGKTKFAKSFLAAKGSIAETADKIVANYLKEIADRN